MPIVRRIYHTYSALFYFVLGSSDLDPQVLEYHRQWLTPIFEYSKYPVALLTVQDIEPFNVIGGIELNEVRPLFSLGFLDL